jgi:hypothetical protein
MPSMGTFAGSTHRRQEGFLEFPPCTFSSTVCLALGCNTTVSLLMTVHASESCNISCGFELVSLILGGVSSSKFFRLLFLADLMHPDVTLRSREGFWAIETWVIRPRPYFLLHSSKKALCRDAAKSKFGFKHTLKERLPNSNLVCRGVKKFNPIPSAGVDNLQTKNEWLNVTTHLK